MSKKSNKKPPAEINLADGGVVIKDDTCFKAHKDLDIRCDSSECRYWQSMDGKHQNCVILAAADGPYTLQEVGDIFSVTRMRICQIEKAAKNMLKGSFDENQC